MKADDTSGDPQRAAHFGCKPPISMWQASSALGWVACSPMHTEEDSCTQAPSSRRGQLLAAPHCILSQFVAARWGNSPPRNQIVITQEAHTKAVWLLGSLVEHPFHACLPTPCLPLCRSSMGVNRPLLSQDRMVFQKHCLRRADSVTAALPPGLGMDASMKNPEGGLCSDWWVAVGSFLTPAAAHAGVQELVPKAGSCWVPGFCIGRAEILILGVGTQWLERTRGLNAPVRCCLLSVYGTPQ